MGHSHGTRWNEELIISTIKEVQRVLCIDRMPTRAECKNATHSEALGNKISKTGGFYFWAEKLGLEKKNSETLTGITYETKIIEKLNNMGYYAIDTPIKFPHDILVNSNVKIDVKFSDGYNSGHGLYYSFNLEYTIPKSDFLILICSDVKTLVVPSHIFTGKKQVSIGKKSKYDCYINKWASIHKLSEFLKTIEQ